MGDQRAAAPRLSATSSSAATPAEHVDGLSKRDLFKKPEYCAACHKQFIDEEVNRVGWVQLQNQYDNWAQEPLERDQGDADPTTVECRECHMPLVDVARPRRGRPWTTTARRRRAPPQPPVPRREPAHPLLLERDLLEGGMGAHRLTENGCKGEIVIPEIADKWRQGPVCPGRLDPAACRSRPGGELAVRVVTTSNKVGHDFPTGPLDIIQSWIEIVVTDDRAATSSSPRAGATSGTSSSRAPSCSRPSRRSVRQPHRPPQPLGDGRRALPARALPRLLGHGRVRDRLLGQRLRRRPSPARGGLRGPRSRPLPQRSRSPRGCSTARSTSTCSTSVAGAPETEAEQPAGAGG
jgi:hypothetical protein